MLRCDYNLPYCPGGHSLEGETDKYRRFVAQVDKRFTLYEEAGVGRQGRLSEQRSKERKYLGFIVKAKQKCARQDQEGACKAESTVYAKAGNQQSHLCWRPVSRVPPKHYLKYPGAWQEMAGQKEETDLEGPLQSMLWSWSFSCSHQQVEIYSRGPAGSWAAVEIDRSHVRLQTGDQIRANWNSPGER